MGQNWWKVWMKIGIILSVVLVLIGIGYFRLQSIMSDYFTSDGMGLYSALKEKEIDYESFIFDIANDYAQQMIEESASERNMITDQLS